MLDDKDRKILNELTKNSRKSTKQIAENIHIPRVTVHDRIQKMVKNGIIKKFTILPNYEKLGLMTTVYVFVASNPYESKISISEIAQKIKSFPGVYEVHIISGEYDILLKIRGKSFDDVGKNTIAKIRQISGIGRTFTCPCFTTVKEG
ncbi:MAG: Lrp/AsnC family transcriptional regulator [Candidatus Thermoplasmatota archaeon]|nr:Lrp/AsnC family transcriptional regulator [Candidatus Thermoplasmatota archaeon]MBS3801148.1 Lrp/AsnC family transcriptional regulator [Candidatus Thermoplasmatota archaeon]